MYGLRYRNTSRLLDHHFVLFAMLLLSLFSLLSFSLSAFHDPSLGVLLFNLCWLLHQLDHDSLLLLFTEYSRLSVSGLSGLMTIGTLSEVTNGKWRRWTSARTRSLIHQWGSNVRLRVHLAIWGDSLWNPEGRVCSKRDGTRAETRFRLSLKWAIPFKSAGASVQSTAGSRGVRISVSMLETPCSEVVWEYWLPTPFASFPFTSPPCVTVSNALYKNSWTIYVNNKTVLLQAVYLYELCI